MHVNPGETMKAPEWSILLTIVDGSINHVPLCDLDQVLLKEVMTENRGLTLMDLKKRCPEYTQITTTGENSDEWEVDTPTDEHPFSAFSMFTSVIGILYVLLGYMNNETAHTRSGRPKNGAFVDKGI